jgi:hypothetical protein
LAGLGSHELPGLCFLLCLIQCLEIMLSYGKDSLIKYFRESLSPLRSESGSKNLVSADNFLYRSFQRLEVERTPYTHTNGDMINRAAWMNLLQEPKSPLRETQWDPAFS